MPKKNASTLQRKEKRFRKKSAVQASVEHTARRGEEQRSVGVRITG